MRGVLLLVIALTSVSAWAGIGTVSDNKGTACEVQRGKNKLPGQKGADIESLDTYVTGSCISNITFKDDTKVKITENSRLLIDDFVFDPKKSDAGKLAMKVAMGTVRYASGQVAKTNPQRVDIKTPTATVAVRGTDFTMTVDEAGQSLVVLVPSCKEEKDIKSYELEEQRCRVGAIDVITDAGKVTLDQAFHATYVISASVPPSPPALLNIVESKISNDLILVKPQEIQNSLANAAKKKRELELEDIEAEAQRQIAKRVKESAPVPAPELLPDTFASGNKGCNPTTNICVLWDKADAIDMQSRGKGIAYRYKENEHYSEVKTQGYSSNTTITIIQNDVPATEIIGDGSPGGNTVIITQNSGVKKR